MALNIKNVESDRLAHELAAATGESLTLAVTRALRERLASVTRRRNTGAVERDVAEIQTFVASLPDRDTRPGDEILGYDELGMP